MLNVILTYQNVPSEKHARSILTNVANLLNAWVYDVEKNGNWYEFCMQTRDASVTHAQILERLANLPGGQPHPDRVRVMIAPSGASDDEDEYDDEDDEDEDDDEG
jgi:hypothetical protein